MQVDITREEIETILKALDCWEKEAGSGAAFASLIGAMLLRPGDSEKEAEEKRNKEAMEKANIEARMRKISSVQIQAKLMQKLSMVTEQA